MVDAKICFSEAVPGGVVSDTYYTGRDTVIAETTTRLVSLKRP